MLLGFLQIEEFGPLQTECLNLCFPHLREVLVSGISALLLTMHYLYVCLRYQHLLIKSRFRGLLQILNQLHVTFDCVSFLLMTTFDEKHWGSVISEVFV